MITSPFPSYYASFADIHVIVYLFLSDFLSTVESTCLYHATDAADPESLTEEKRKIVIKMFHFKILNKHFFFFLKKNISYLDLRKQGEYKKN